ncbi:MAG TPA: type II toxin-antitoxin system RelE/ParE family toxin [Planctomycetaceae bacterium]
MGRIRVDPQAWLDLLVISDYLTEVAKNRRAAHRLAEEFDRKCEVYARQPGMGDLREDLGENLRSFTFRRWYVAVYRPLDDGVDVLRVFDGRSDYGRFFAE